MSDPAMQVTPGLNEPRTRVSFYLPCNVSLVTSVGGDTDKVGEINVSKPNRRHIRVLNGIVRYLASLQNENRNLIRGFTISNYPKTAFSGCWYNAKDEELPDGSILAKGWWQDNIVQLIVDYHYPFGSTGLNEALMDLKNAVTTIYRSNGCYEVDYWIVAHPTNRFA